MHSYKHTHTHTHTHTHKYSIQIHTRKNKGERHVRVSLWDVLSLWESESPLRSEEDFLSDEDPFFDLNQGIFKKGKKGEGKGGKMDAGKVKKKPEKENLCTMILFNYKHLHHGRKVYFPSPSLFLLNKC